MAGDGGARRGVRGGLEEARGLIRSGRFAEAGAMLQSLARDALERQEFYLLRAQCFLALGQFYEAERSLRWARRIGSDDGAIAARIGAISEQRAARTAECRARAVVQGLRVTGFLGDGWEGAVYRCEDRDGRVCVVKQFHPNQVDIVNSTANWHRRPAASTKSCIVHLGRMLQRAPHPLFFGYDGIVRQGRLEALRYPYRRLHAIGRSQLEAPALRLALVRAALAGQAHLIEQAGMMMVDLRAGQFMLDQLARIRYVDYGASILPLEDYRIRDESLHVQALILFLVEIFAWDEWRDFSRLQVIADPPEQLQRRIDDSPGLQRCLDALPALGPFLGPDAVLDSAKLTDPGIYRAAAAAIPACRPVAVLARSVAWDLRRGVRRLRRRLGC